uniref:Uncharacterized protein n=2 Tax=Caenorhabditis japonica TaxID=281687 RepID=A0A8R1E9R7_CAEJA
MTDATSSNFSAPDNWTSLGDVMDSGWLASTSVQAFNGAMDVLEESYPLCKKMIDHKTLFPDRGKQRESPKESKESKSLKG